MFYWKPSPQTPVKSSSLNYLNYTPITYQQQNSPQPMLSIQETNNFEESNKARITKISEVQIKSNDGNEKINDLNNPNSLIKANIINNRNMIFHNYSQLDFAMIFEEQLQILNKHQAYARKVHTVRGEFPTILQAVINLKELKEDILSVEKTVGKQEYQNLIKPKTIQMIEQTVSIQKMLSRLSAIEEIPANPYYSNNNTSENLKLTEFNFTYYQFEQEMNNYEHQLTLIITKIKQQQAQQEMYDDQEQFKVNQQSLKEKKIQIVDYLNKKLTQSLVALARYYQQEISVLQKNVYQDLHVHIVYFYEKLSIIEGHINIFEQLQVIIMKYEKRLIEFQITYHDFSQFYNNIKRLFFECSGLKNKVKAIFQTKNEPILQNLQMKYKKKLELATSKLFNEIELLLFQGQLIEQFNLEEELNQFSQQLLDEQVSNIKDYFEELYHNYIQKQYSLPFSEAKQLNEMFFKLMESYSKSNYVRSHLNQLLHQVEFAGYKSHIKEIMIPLFTISIQELCVKKNQFLTQKFENQFILDKITNLLQFEFPKFDWQESSDLEQDRVLIVYERYNWVKESISDCEVEHLSKEYKFMKKILAMDQELEKSLTILEQYFSIKEKIGNQRIDLITWPNITLQIINESSKYCQQIIQQANSILLTIEQLNQMNLFTKVKQLLQQDSLFIYDELSQIYNLITNDPIQPMIKHQVNIVSDFLFHCLKHLEMDVDLHFCSTSTYSELEEILEGRDQLIKLKNVNEQNERDKEIRNILYVLVDQFMKQKLVSDFSNLFQLKIIQSQGGTSDFDPEKLVNRTDLLYPVLRADINSNQYCQLEKIKIEQIVDQPELRLVFQLFNELLRKITKILNKSSNFEDNTIDQIEILQHIDEFQQQIPFQINLTDMQPMIEFHQKLSEWPKIQQIDNFQVQLGKVLQKQYSQYLHSCRNRIKTLSQGISVLIDSLDENEINLKVKFIIDNRCFSFQQLFKQYFYKDFQSVIIDKLAETIRVEGSLKVYCNEKQFQ